jgi:hypothetical protein
LTILKGRDLVVNGRIILKFMREIEGEYVDWINFLQNMEQ